MYRQKPFRTRLTPLAAALLALYSGPNLAEEKMMPRVDVIGGAENLPAIAGAATVLESKDLQENHVFTVNEALRKVPGVHARDEEGFGLRPNIAMRGLNPTRSTKITLLEDGIPLAYAPYGDNASYYHPMVERYDRIEVLKGSGALLFGPQTIGGVINYITPAPTQEFGGYVQGTVGNRDYFNGKVNLGGNGMLLDYSRKQGDGARDNMEHALDDLNLKYVTALGNNQALTLRANYYQEDSTITYTGLTQAEFDKLGARYNPFKNDKFDTDRSGLSATHEYDFGSALLTTSLYYSRFNRDWWRQSSNTADSQCGGAFTTARNNGTAVDADSCNSVQGRLRSYTTWGVEPRLTMTHDMGEFQAGVKAHFEEQDRLQLNGISPMARTGTTVEDSLRESTAYSGFIANRFDVGRVGITPILRYETIDAERSSNLPGGTASSTSVSKTLPGIGVTWNPGDTLTLFSSLHKGFAPPRVEDLIGATNTATTVIDVNAEESTNFELGVRSRPLPWASVQAAYFRNDFQNLIAAGSIAGGSTPLSEGEAEFEGAELSALAEHESGVFGRLAWTWLPTADQETPFRRVDTKAVVTGSAAGNRQPYAPEHTVTVAAGYGAGALRGEIESQYVGEQFSDFANSVAPTVDGQKGRIEAYAVWNASLNYQLRPKGATVFLSAKNLTDKTYIVDRTRGIQVGMPRLVQVGMKYPF
ncbi:MAG: hypothetical protein A2V90_05095 [Gammaproteobacteria bacterium RBG_16_57_12]|nr:MAG: hypothetical protein A2V90_05095 [Gammaproteobacteria bacterium RBG_16_57_12]